MADDVGTRLRQLRKRAGLEKKAEAERLAGLCSGHLWQVEENSERSGVRTETAQKLARLYGATLDYILAGQGKPPTDQELADAVAAAKARLGSPRGAS